MADVYLVRAFNFLVSLHRSSKAEEGAPGTQDASTSGQPLADGGFQECSGLEIEMDVQEYAEGGRNDGTIRRLGRAKYQPLVLKRGMFLSPAGVLDDALWRWFQEAVGGQVFPRRYDGIIEVLGVRGATVATWTFTRGLPAKIVGPALNARTGEIAIEEIHIAHEGLRLVIPPAAQGGG